MSRTSRPNPAPPRQPLDAPPPYSTAPNDVLVARSSPSTAASLYSSPSASSTTLSSVPETKSAQLYEPPQPVEELQPVEEFTRPPPEPLKQPDFKLPQDIQRAQAPLKIRQKNTALKGNFLVFKAESRPGASSSGADVPDVRLENQNASLKAGVYIGADEWDRPVTLDISTKNSSISLAVDTLLPGQAVDIKATTKNSSANVLLPRDFKGLLILSTTHGKITLSPDLQRASVHVPNRDEWAPSPDDSIVHKVSQAVLEELDDTHTLWYEINGGDGPSRAVVKTKNARVSAGFVGDEGECDGGKSCVVM